MELEIITQTAPDDTVTVSPRGIIDAYSRDKLEGVFNHLFDQKLYNVIVDLAQVDYMSSVGVGIFIGVFSTVEGNNGSLKLINLRPAVKEVFELLGLTQLFPID